MPTVRQEIVHSGERFTGVIPTSLCCPSRAALLSGNLAHTTGVYKNVGDGIGGWAAFNASGYEDKTIATALDSAGYQTALIGKYLNGWVSSPQSFVPPGWDEFTAIRKTDGNPKLSEGAYYNYTLTGTQPTTSYGNTPADYSTDVLADLSVSFVKQSVAGDPFFLYFSPFAPHGPFTPAPRDIGTWAPAKPYRNQAVDELDMSDKPAFMQSLPKVSLKYIDRAQTKSGEALKAVDVAVRRLIAAAGPEVDNTLFIFMSDNALMWGEHRLTKKNKPYRWSTDVPLFARWDGHITPRSKGGLAANVDVTATILEAAGIPNALSTEGISMLSGQRPDILLEAVGDSTHPSYCGVRRAHWLFVEYSGYAGNQGTELYNYNTDRLELNNLASVPSYRNVRQQLRARSHELCNPTPPGFTWTASGP